MGVGAGTDLTFVNAAVMKDSLATGPGSRVRRRAHARVRARRDRSTAAADAVGLKVSYDDPDYLAGVVFDRLVFGFNPYGQPGHRHAGDAGVASRATTSSRSTRAGSAPTTRSWRSSATRRRTRRSPAPSARSASGDASRFPRPGRPSRRRPTRRVVIIDRPGAVQTEIRVGNVALPRHHPDYLALDIAIEDSRRRRRQPAAPRAALGARPHLRRVGRRQRAEGQRRSSSPRPTPGRRRRPRRCD